MKLINQVAKFCCKTLILCLITPLIASGTDHNIIPPIPYEYASFQDGIYDLFLWEGDNIVLLTKSESLDPEVMSDLVSALDDAYDFYRTSTGREPALLSNYNGKTIIAQVNNTCGAGCGHLGYTGIEILDYFFNQLYNTYATENKYDQIPFYELGRNFWFYGNKIEMGSSATGYAVFMRDMTLEYLDLDPADFNHQPFENLTAEVKGLIDDYLDNPAYNWENTIAENVAPSNSFNLGGESLFASFLYRLKRDFGGMAFVQKFWKEVGKRPDALNKYDAADNFILASCASANQNLVPLFQQWRWPVSQKAINEASELFGPTSNQILINAKGSEAGGAFAHFSIYFNDIQIGESFTSPSYDIYTFFIPSEMESPDKIKVVFDNNAAIDGNDRNLYVRSVAWNGTTYPAPGDNVTYIRNDNETLNYSGVMPWNGDLIFDTRPLECEGNILLSSQKEVDAFNCSSVYGELTINGSDIVNLNSLQGLHFAMRLYIEDNPLLKNLDGLNDLTLTGGFIIKNNDALEDLSGLSNLVMDNMDYSTPMNGEITHNPSLTSLEGLGGIGELWSLNISDNANLENLTGLESLRHIWANFTISNNPELATIDGLTSLNEVDFEHNSHLGHLNITNNNSLTNIDELSSLLVANDVTITNNPLLTRFCGLYPLLNEGEIYGNISISDNGSNCTEADILAGGRCEERNLVVIAKGLEAGGVFAHFKVFIDGQEIGNEFTQSDYHPFTFPLVQDASSIREVRLEYDNDAVIEDDDRNLFIQSIEISGTLYPASGDRVTYIRRDGSDYPYNGTMWWNGNLIFEVGPIICEDIVLTSQAEVNQFSCKEIYGALTISGEDIIDLTPLNSLTSVAIKIDIVGNPNLINLEGLNNLQHTQGFTICNNAKLESLNGLSSLVMDDMDYGNLWIGEISHNPSLTSLEGLEGINELWNFTISDNASLENLNGLESLRHIWGNFSISNNPELTTIDGLASLIEVDFLYHIHSGHLDISNNYLLSNIDGLSSLLTANDVDITNNPSLKRCCGLYPLLNEGKVYGEIDLSNNGSDCNISDILAGGHCDKGELIINAKGTKAGGEFAHFRLLIDGQETGDEFTQSDYQPYSFSLTQDPSSIQEIRIVYDNDAVVEGEDRNLSIMSMELDGSVFSAPGDYVTYIRSDGSTYPYNGTMWWRGDLIFDFTSPNARISSGNELEELLRNDVFENEKWFDFIVYPNPGHGRFTIESINANKDPINMILYDIAGNKIMEKTFPSFKKGEARTMDISSINNGVYILKMQNKGEVFIERLIVN